MPPDEMRFDFGNNENDDFNANIFRGGAEILKKVPLNAAPREIVQLSNLNISKNILLQMQVSFEEGVKFHGNKFYA